MKITIKLPNNHHSEPPGIWLNRSPTRRDLKRSHIMTGRRGRDTEWVGPTHMWWIKIRREPWPGGSFGALCLTPKSCRFNLWLGRVWEASD